MKLELKKLQDSKIEAPTLYFTPCTKKVLAMGNNGDPENVRLVEKVDGDVSFLRVQE